MGLQPPFGVFLAFSSIISHVHGRSEPVRFGLPRVQIQFVRIESAAEFTFLRLDAAWPFILFVHALARFAFFFLRLRESRLTLALNLVDPRFALRLLFRRLRLVWRRLLFSYHSLNFGLDRFRLRNFPFSPHRLLFFSRLRGLFRSRLRAWLGFSFLLRYFWLAVTLRRLNFRRFLLAGQPETARLRFIETTPGQIGRFINHFIFNETLRSVNCGP